MKKNEKFESLNSPLFKQLDLDLQKKIKGGQNGDCSTYSSTTKRSDTSDVGEMDCDHDC